MQRVKETDLKKDMRKMRDGEGGNGGRAESAALMDSNGVFRH